MTMSPEQMRKKSLAMDESMRHAKYNVVGHASDMKPSLANEDSAISKPTNSYDKDEIANGGAV
jgi:hypothetical protein